jgi:hypothetical protein
LRYRKHQKRLGTRKLFYEMQDFLKAHQFQIGRDALFDLLSEHGLLVISRKRKGSVTTFSKHRFKKYPNIVKGFIPIAPNQLWVSDITYIHLKEGFAYLSLITDAYSHKIVGTIVGTHITIDGTPVRLMELPTRLLELPTRLMELATRLLELPTRLLELATRLLELPIRFMELPTRLLELPTRLMELATRLMELPTRLMELAIRLLELVVPDSSYVCIRIIFANVK